jgi:hypothetical protein
MCFCSHQKKIEEEILGGAIRMYVYTGFIYVVISFILQENTLRDFSSKPGGREGMFWG